MEWILKNKSKMMMQVLHTYMSLYERANQDGLVKDIAFHKDDIYFVYYLVK